MSAADLEAIAYRIKRGFKDNPEYDKADVLLELGRLLAGVSVPAARQEKVQDDQTPTRYSAEQIAENLEVGDPRETFVRWSDIAHLFPTYDTKEKKL